CAPPCGFRRLEGSIYRRPDCFHPRLLRLRSRQSCRSTTALERVAEVRDKINKKVKKQLHPYRYGLVFALRFKSGDCRRGELNPCDNPCLRALAVSLVPNIKRDRSEHLYLLRY